MKITPLGSILRIKRKMIKHLKSPWILIVGYVLAAAFNLPHMVEAYDLLGVTNLPVAYKWAVLIIVDITILILAINGDEDASYFFAGLVFCINIFAHWVRIPFVVDLGMIATHGPGLLFSILASSTVWYYAKRISDRMEVEQQIEDIGNLSKALETAQKSLDKNEDKIDDLQTKLEKAQERSKLDQTIIEELQATLGNTQKALDAEQKRSEKFRHVFESVRVLNGSPMSVGGKKARKCKKCLVITVAASNKVNPPCQCCGGELDW